MIVIDAPGTRPHALPLQKGEFYDTWSCSPSDFWRIARAKAQDGEFTYGSGSRLPNVCLLTHVFRYSCSIPLPGMAAKTTQAFDGPHRCHFRQQKEKEDQQ
jgi:hypothetical protein